MFIRSWIIKNHNRLIAGDLSRQKELGEDPKAIKQIQFVGQIKKRNNKNDDAKSKWRNTKLKYEICLQLICQQM